MGKASRRKRNRDTHQETPRWTAADAARTAHRWRLEAAERLDGPAVLTELLKGQLLEAASDNRQFLASQGATLEEAAAVAQHTASAGLDGERMTHDEVARRLIARDVDTLRHADTYVVSPEMNAVVIAAAESLSGAADIATFDSETDLPSPTGFLLLPAAVIVRPYGVNPTDLHAFSWGEHAAKVSFDGATARGAHVASYYDANGRLRLHPASAPVLAALRDIPPGQLRVYQQAGQRWPRCTAGRYPWHYDGTHRCDPYRPRLGQPWDSPPRHLQS